MEAKKQGIWSSVPPRVRLLIASQVLNGLAFGYFMIYVTAFLPANGLGGFSVAVILGVEGITMVFAGIPFAILSDRRGRKWFLVAGNALFAPTILVFALTSDVMVYYAAAAMAGLGEAMSLSSWNALIADMTDLGNRDHAFSLSFIFGTGSFSMGAVLPLAFPWVAGVAGVTSAAVHSSALLLMGAANLASPFIIFALLRGHRETLAAGERPKMDLGSMKRTLTFSLCNSVVGFGAGLIIPLLPLWLLYKFGVHDTFSGPFLALSGLTIAFAAVASPRLSKRLGLFRAMIATAGGSTAFMFSLAFLPNVYVACGIYLVRAGLMNMNSPLMDSFLMGITPTQQRGLASTLNAIIWRVPNNVSTIIGGAVLTSAAFDVPQLGLTHFDVLWVVATCFYVAGISLLYVLFRKVEPSA